ncbi:uncharacterized protein CTHT_0037160 [Thermochaetoides thermophila DSM 1495]|uniref:Rhodopsin domain-containing protein n=1 Tax=Chaetomium thermophilum (strain DSM 1495 / CBS 144.50 / IMI 039719) TaxID=759272 RepID=G0S7V8_CHATD|nr:hypothetical protein CTHT_0037160 [Thermochaetoides thermophila DSM 1495]EGS21845.1 hypothetical protein CTHT_0037160 [Thermochaetoides thermophila DSM 1495]
MLEHGSHIMKAWWFALLFYILTLFLTKVSICVFLVIATDFMIFLLPVPVVYPLKLPRRQKFALVTIFAIGFFVCLISLIRLWILIKTQSNPNPDFTYAGTPLIYWTVIEVDTAIVVACAMTLKPLITRFFPNLLIPRSIWDASVLESNGRPRTIGSAPWRPGGGARGIGDVGMESMRNGDSVDLGLGGGQVSPSEGTDVGSTWGRSNGEELGKMTAKSLG